MKLPKLRDIALSAAIAAAYFIAGKLGLGLAFVNASTTAVWPPTGIAIAGFLIFGRRIWPGVAIGAFLVNATTAGGVFSALSIAVGNTLEGWVGAELVARYARGRRAFEHPHDIFKYAVLAGMLSTTIAATVGATSLIGAHLARPEEFGAIWFTWWLGDAAGALVMGPLIVIGSSIPARPALEGRVAETLAMFLTLVITAVFVFGPVPLAFRHYPLEFLTLPALVWAAFRFTVRETSTAIALLSGIAIWGTLRGQGPFAGRSPNEALLMLQAFMAVSSVMALALAASVEERQRVEARVLRLNEELEDRVMSRTIELSTTNQELRAQVLERQEAEQGLKASEARLREAQQVAHIGNWEWDIERNLIWWSEELYSIYDIDRESFRAASYDAFLERVHPDDRERVHAVIATALHDGLPFAFEHRVVRPDGSVRFLSAQGHVIRDAAGRPVRLSGIGQDITERKHAEQERENLLGEQIARREAEEANRMKDEFLATLSHELRTPLNAIVGWADLLRSGRLDAAAMNHAVEIISRNAHVQSQLISDILDISRITSGQFELKREPTELRGVVEHAIDTMRPTAQARNIVIRAELGEARLPIVGDSARLVQVVWNLLSNAIKFAPDGGWVRVALSADAARARLRVEDNGPGIDPEILPYVFDRFRSGDTSSTRRHGGLGLGLAIVRHIVELHDGEVSGSNRAGGSGAVFEVVLPRSPRPIEPARTVGLEPQSARALSADGKPLAGMRILLVENDADSREAIAVLLGGRGAEVEAVGSAAEAMTTIRRWKPHLLISDIEMPGENGYDLIAKVRALPESQGGSIPAIAITAHVGREDVRRAIQAGYQVHLSKPIWLDQLLSTVADVTRWSEATNRD
jgi:PAS domain S-box-containing protein